MIDIDDGKASDPWDMVDLRYDLISFSLEKLLSAGATVTDRDRLGPKISPGILANHIRSQIPPVLALP